MTDNKKKALVALAAAAAGIAVAWGFLDAAQAAAITGAIATVLPLLHIGRKRAAAKAK